MSVTTKSTEFSSGFTPQVIPGLGMWLDAADSNTFTFVGTKISQWSDKSGSNNHAFETTDSRRPSYDSANKRVFFSNSLNQLSVTNPAIRPTNIFVVAQAINANKEHHLFRKGNAGGTDLEYFVRFSTTNTLAGTYVNTASTQVVIDTTPTTATTALQLISMEWDATTMRMYQNASQHGTNTALSGTQRTATSGASNLRIGAVASVADNTSGPNTTTSLNGYIYEIAFYNRMITSVERQQVEGYLMNKWGLSASIPATHPYRYIPPFLRGFWPIDIANCQLWLDAADLSTITLSGSNVTQWNDKSGNSTILTVSTGTPTLSQFNTRPSIYFNGASRMASSNYTGLQGVRHINWFVVANPTSINLNYGLLIGTNYTPGAYSQNDLYVLSNSLQLFYRGVSGGASKSVSQSINNGNAMIASSFTNLESGAHGVYYNGTGTTATGGIIGTQDSATSALYIGSDSYPGLAFITGTISECLLYTRALTTFERQQIEGYLAAKWGLMAKLPTTQPFSRFPPLNPMFTPPALSGLSLWLDAADRSTLTFSGSNITTWADKSGNGRNMTSTGTIVYNATQRRVELNGATNSFFTGTISSTPLSNPSYVIVSRQTTGNGPLFTLQINSFGYFPQYTKVYLQSGTSTWAEIATSPVTNGVDYIHSIVYNTSTVELWLSGSNALNSARTAFTTSALDIGARRGGTFTERMTGFIYEFLVFNSPLSRDQRQQVEGYLAAKWGLQSSLPSTHPYKKSGP